MMLLGEYPIEITRVLIILINSIYFKGSTGPAVLLRP